MILYFKALHVVFAVLWFAGLFCVMQLLLYQQRALHEPGAAPKDLQRLTRRLWLFVAWPSFVLTVLFGGAILHPWIRVPWFQLKVLLLLLLFACHVICHRLYQKCQRNDGHKVRGLRVLSESINLLLFAVVTVAVLQDVTSFLWLLLAMLLLVGVSVACVRLVRRLMKNPPR